MYVSRFTNMRTLLLVLHLQFNKLNILGFGLLLVYLVNSLYLTACANKNNHKQMCTK